jgi:hypothetical protein
MAALTASPSEDCASMMQSRKHCLALSVRALSPLQPLPPRKPENDGIKCAMLSVAIWKRRAMPPTGPSGNTMPRTPRTGWWRVSLKRAGTGRSLTRRRSRARSPCMMRRRSHPLLIQLRSAFWPRTSKRPGMRRRRMLASRSALCAPSSMRSWPISTTRRPRSFSSSTGWVAPTASCACPSAGADSATELPPILSKPCVSWC